MTRDYIDKLILKYSYRNVHTNTISIARSILAFSLLVSLIVDGSSLFPKEYIENIRAQSAWSKYNLFLLFKHSQIIYSIVIAVVILIIVVLGVIPKISALLHFWVSLSYLNASVIIEGGDQIAIILTFFLFLIIIFDKRKNLWSSAKENSHAANIISNFILLLIKIQMCVLYFHAATGKLIIEEWLEGTALYYWGTHNIFGVHPFVRGAFEFIFSSPFFLTLTTWAVILLELLLSASIFFSEKVKPIILWLGLLFHFAIFLMMGLFNFWLYMSAALILYLHPINEPITIKILKKWNHTFRLRKYVKPGF